MFLVKAPAQTSVNSTRSLSCHSPACVIKDEDAVYWPVNSLPVSPAHSQKPGPGAQPEIQGGQAQLLFPQEGRARRPLSLPGGAQRFALCSTANFPEREACALPGLSKLTDCVCGEDRSIARGDLRAHRHPQHGALSSSGCACECGPIPQFQAQLIRAQEDQQSQQSLNVRAHLLPASARPPTNMHIQIPSPLSFIKFKDRK